MRGQRAVAYGEVDAGQILHDHGAGPEVHMADLGVAHLPLRQADGQPAGGQRRVRVPPPELVEDRRIGEGDGVTGPVGGQSPTVEYHQHR